MTLPRSSLSVRMHCRVRRFLRKSRPVRLGQTPLGLLVAATLILLWGLERPAAAAFVSGSSENEYFTLSWLYDLEYGRGELYLQGKERLITDGVVLHGASFTTRGIAPEFTTGRGILQYWGAPVDIGVDKGQHVYEYNFSARGALGLGLPAIGSASLRFPSTGVELVASKMTIAGGFMGLTSGIGNGFVSGIVRPFGPVTMDYVTVQAIPEPGTVALAGVAAAAAVAGWRRRREDDQQQDPAEG
jgi:hypothetical protein